jgi:hypothetical protein
VHIISFTNLRRFGDVHPDAMPSLRRWFMLARRADVSNMNEIVRLFGGARAL